MSHGRGGAPCPASQVALPCDQSGRVQLWWTEVWLRGSASRLPVVWQISTRTFFHDHQVPFIWLNVFLPIIKVIISLPKSHSFAKLLAGEVPSPFAQERCSYCLVGYSSQHQHCPISFTFPITIMLLSLFMDLSKALAPLQYDTVSSKK